MLKEFLGRIFGGKAVRETDVSEKEYQNLNEQPITTQVQQEPDGLYYGEIIPIGKERIHPQVLALARQRKKAIRQAVKEARKEYGGWVKDGDEYINPYAIYQAKQRGIKHDDGMPKL